MLYCELDSRHNKMPRVTRSLYYVEFRGTTQDTQDTLPSPGFRFNLGPVFICWPFIIECYTLLEYERRFVG